MCKNYVNISLFRVKEDKKPITVFSRSSTILPSFVDRTFNVHNGKSFIKIKIKKPMVGYKFGSFVQTKNNSQYKKWIKK